MKIIFYSFRSIKIITGNAIDLMLEEPFSFIF